MALSVGDTVSLRYTGERGRIVRSIEEDVWEVWLDAAKMEIPVDADNLVKIEVETADIFKKQFIDPPEKTEPVKPTPAYAVPNAKPPAPGSSVPSMQGSTPPKPQSMGPQPSKGIISETGLLAALIPEFGYLGHVSSYRLWIINDTQKAWQLLGNLSETPIDIWLDAGHSYSPRLVGTPELEKGSALHWQLSEKMTDGSRQNLPEQHIRVKHKWVLSDIEAVPCLQTYGHLVILQSDFKKTASAESLKEYTQRHIETQAPKAPQPEEHVVPLGVPNAAELASFPRELDLHIEHLHSDPAALDNTAMLQIQMAHFEKYLLKALRLGIEEVSIIHGKGAGVLRKEIRKRLMQLQPQPRLEMRYKGMLNEGVTHVTF